MFEKTCPRCNTKHKYRARFCDSCGFDFQSSRVCSYCHTYNAYGFPRCSKCGLSVDGNYTPDQIDDAVWSAFCGSEAGEQRYLQLYPNGRHAHDILERKEKERRRTRCPYCHSQNADGFKYCSTCGLSVDGNYTPEQIDDAVWKALKMSSSGRARYESLYPHGKHIQEAVSIRKKQEEARKTYESSVYSIRKVFAYLLYALAVVILIVILIVGKDGVKLLGLPSAAPIWWLGRCLDPDENS